MPAECISNTAFAAYKKNAVTDDNNIVSTLVVKKVKTHQQTVQKIAKIISYGEGSRFEY